MGTMDPSTSLDKNSEEVVTAAQYSNEVYQWLLQAHQWDHLARGFPAYLAYQASLQQQASNASSANISGHSQNPTPANESESTGLDWREFKLPKLWKRGMAEFIDFIILFILKLIVTYIAIDWLGLISADGYDRAMLLAATANGDIDLLTSLEMTTDIMLLEVIHKFLVCFFEALWTCSGSRNGGPGGATPGKLVMGLRIYHCDQVISTNEDTVQIVPAESLGVKRATIRAILKNVATAFFFPSWLTIFVSPHFRAAHDVVAKTIVLEVPVRN